MYYFYRFLVKINVFLTTHFYHKLNRKNIKTKVLL